MSNVRNMMKTGKSFLPALWVLTVAVGFACKDDHDDGHSHEGDLEGDCAVISDACHEADDGAGKANECHELAHENDTAACGAELDACVTACEEHTH